MLERGWVCPGEEGEGERWAWMVLFLRARKWNGEGDIFGVCY